MRHYKYLMAKDDGTPTDGTAEVLDARYARIRRLVSTARATMGVGAGAFADVAMASPPTISHLATSAIGTGTTRRLNVPALGSSDAGPARLTGACNFRYYSNRPTSAGNDHTSLSASAAAGATTLTVPVSVTPGTYWVGSGAQFVATVAEHQAAETVTVSSVSGSGPYTLTLAAPTANAHNSGDLFVTTATPNPGYNKGSAVTSWQYYGGGNLVADVLTDAATLEWFAYYNGAAFSVYVDGELAGSGTFASGTSPVPSANAAGFMSMAFGSSAWRRVTIITTGYLIGVRVAATETVMAPPEPRPRLLFVSDSWGTDTGRAFARALGLRNGMILDAIGGTGYENDNSANLGGNPGRATYRMPGHVVADPDVAVVALGLNDDQNSVTLADEISDYLTELKAALPDTFICAVGPWSNGSGSGTGGQNGGSNLSKPPVATAIKAACAALNIPYIDTMLGEGPGVNPWMFGTGTSTNPTGDGNADTMMNNDGTHPNSYGAGYTGFRIAQGVVSALGLE